MEFFDLPRDVYSEIRRYLEAISLHALRTTCSTFLHEKYFYHHQKPHPKDAFQHHIYFTRQYYDWIHTVVKFPDMEALPILQYFGWNKSIPIINNVDLWRRISSTTLVCSVKSYSSLNDWRLFVPYMSPEDLCDYFANKVYDVIYDSRRLADLTNLWDEKRDVIMDLSNFERKPGDPFTNRNNFIRGTIGKYMRGNSFAPRFYREMSRLYIYRARPYR